MTRATRVAEVMGGYSVLGTRIRSLGDLDRAVANGLPKPALGRTVRRVMHAPRDAARLLAAIGPPATYKRRRTAFTAAESERIERLARAIAAAEEAWGDRDAAEAWMLAPHQMLEGKRPVDAALTELGARRVEALLDRLVHGLPA
jgi:putative toxin-antitoxin system antitoxin component (TIGR02293 family)